MPVGLFARFFAVVRFARGHDAHDGQLAAAVVVVIIVLVVGRGLHDAFGLAVDFREDAFQCARTEAAVVFVQDADELGLDALVVAAGFGGAKGFFEAEAAVPVVLLLFLAIVFLFGIVVPIPGAIASCYSMRGERFEAPWNGYLGSREDFVGDVGYNDSI